MITGRQIRAARALLDWTAVDLAEKSGLTRETVSRIEVDNVQARDETLDKIVSVFEYAGLEFLPNEGVRRKDRQIQVFEGPDKFDDFYTFLYERLKVHGGDVCLSVTDETLLAKYRKNSAIHYERMQDLYDRGIIKSFRILANKSNFGTTYPYNTYKWQPDSALAPTAFYTFGDCLALISFTHSPAPYVAVLQSAPIADSYRQAFNITWAAAKDPSKSRVGKTK